MEIKVKNWGVTKKNENVLMYTLKNDFMEVEILNYGGVIRKISTPNKNGELGNVVLNLPTIKDYEERSPFFGALIGRNAGRISEGVFSLNGETYTLAKNNGNNNLHGGIDSFGRKVWKAEELIGKNYIGVKLSIESPHLEEGFPGNVKVEVRYILKDNELSIEYFGTTDRPTYLNLTNHTYFNLSGDFERDITDEYLQLDCNEFIAVDEATLPVKIKSVINSAFDFRELTLLKNSLYSDDEQIKIVNQGLDHPFILNHSREEVIHLEDKVSGRVVEVITDQPAVVIYTGNYLYEVGNLNDKIECKKHMGICFETQNYADALRFLPEKAFITTPEIPYNQKTKFIFKTK